MTDNRKLTHGRTSVYNLNYHIIWGTKYCNKVLNGKVEIDLKEILLNIAKEKGFEIAHMEIGKDDHVHLLITAPPKLSVTTIVSYLKGISALRLFQRYPDLQRQYWLPEGQRHLWSSSYFVESIGVTNQDAIAKYIDDQRKKEQDL